MILTRRMSLLLIGIAVGLVAAFMLRTLMQYERQGLAQVVEGMERLEVYVAELEDRIESLEVIAARDEALPEETGSSGMTTGSHVPERRTRA